MNLELGDLRHRTITSTRFPNYYGFLNTNATSQEYNDRKRLRAESRLISDGVGECQFLLTESERLGRLERQAQKSILQKEIRRENFFFFFSFFFFFFFLPSLSFFLSFFLFMSRGVIRKQALQIKRRGEQYGPCGLRESSARRRIGRGPPATSPRSRPPHPCQRGTHDQ